MQVCRARVRSRLLLSYACIRFDGSRSRRTPKGSILSRSTPSLLSSGSSYLFRLLKNLYKEVVAPQTCVPVAQSLVSETVTRHEVYDGGDDFG